MPTQEDGDFTSSSQTLNASCCSVSSITDRRPRSVTPQESPDDFVNPSNPSTGPGIKDDVTSEGTEETEHSLWNSSRKDKLILFCLALHNLLLFMSLSIMAPFYPKEANKRGISNTVSGIVFGTFSLVQFLTSPLFGKLTPVVGCKFLFIAGIFFAGGGSILYGALGYLPYTEDGRLYFVIYCFVLDVAISLGCSGGCTASFAMCALLFPQDAAKTLGFIEAFTGVGLVLGPALGGVLYDLGGFMLPFATVGALMIASVPVYICILPAKFESHENEHVPVMKLLSNPAFLITSFGVFLGAIIWAVLDPTLEPHLRKFHLSSSLVGLVFLIMSISYTVFAPVCGWIADRISNSLPLIILGFFGGAVSMLLLGPSPIILLDDYQQLWLNIVSLLLMGIFICLAVVPTFDRCIVIADVKLLDNSVSSEAGGLAGYRVTVGGFPRIQHFNTGEAGLEINMGTHSAIAGLWMSSYALGEFVGPTAAGVAVDTVGFEWTTTYTAGISAFGGFVMLAMWIYERHCQATKVDVTPPESLAPDEISETAPLITGRSISSQSLSETESVVSISSIRSRQSWYAVISGRSRPPPHRHLGYINNSQITRRFQRCNSTPHRRSSRNSYTGYESV